MGTQGNCGTDMNQRTKYGDAGDDNVHLKIRRKDLCYNRQFLVVLCGTLVCAVCARRGAICLVFEPLAAGRASLKGPRPATGRSEYLCGLDLARGLGFGHPWFRRSLHVLLYVVLFVKNDLEI